MSLADKLTAVAENVPKVYEAGQKSVAVMAAANGNPAVLDYVHPTEHELAVTVSRGNLLDIEKCNVNTSKPIGLTIEKEGDVVHVYGTMTQCNSYASFVILYLDDYELSGKGYAVQGFDVDTNKVLTEAESGLRFYGLSSASDKVIAMLIRHSTTGLEVDYRFRISVSESAQTTYAPYIVDLSGVSVTRYGRNLVDGADLSSHINANGSPLESVTFNGRQCLKTTLNKENMIDRYGRYTFDVPVTYFSAEVYSEGCTTSVFTLFRKDGTNQYLLPSRNIDDWKIDAIIATEDNPIVGISMYVHKTTEDQLVYIDLNGFYGSLATTAEEKVLYISPQTATANADGTVDGIMSVAPTSVLVAADDDVTINAEYYLDAGRKLAEMGVTLLNLGGDL